MSTATAGAHVTTCGREDHARRLGKSSVQELCREDLVIPPGFEVALGDKE